MYQKMYRLLIVLLFLTIQAEAVQVADIDYSFDTKNDALVLKMKIKEGWNIYDQYNKEIPFKIELNKESSSNISAISVQWPETKLIQKDVLGEKIKLSAYSEEIDIKISLLRNDSKIHSSALLNISYGACSVDNCIIIQSNLNANIPPLQAKQNLVFMLSIALLAGFILNFMPCALPVLSLKIISIVKYSYLSRSQIRLNLILISIGIWISFICLALITIALRAAGISIGWGFHFHEPGFLMFLIFILMLFVANLMEYFHIKTPRFISPIAQKLNSYSQYIESIISGAFATLLATPCTAPFLSTILSFALSQNTITILFLYSFLALGMALPYLIISINTKWVTKIPKSGRWFVVLRKIMIFALLAAIVWLIHVLYRQVTLKTFIVFLTFILAVDATLIVYRNNGIFKMKNLKNFLNSAVGYVILIFVIFILTNSFIKKDENNIWNNFSINSLQKYVQNSSIVLVNVTADWCMTCKVNEKLILEDQSLLSILKSKGTIFMKADYTTKSIEISKYMSSHKRYGIPLYIIYGPFAKEGIVLPEVLNKQDLVAALNSAIGKLADS